MFAIEIHSVFTAAHQLRLPGGKVEALHSHDWRVRVRVEAEELDALETVMDFHELEAMLKAVTEPLHETCLNEREPFQTRVNPSAERVAEFIGLALSEPVRMGCGGRMRRLEVWVTEAPQCAAGWWRTFE